MERRTILKNLGFSILTLSQLPSWASSWRSELFEEKPFFLSKDNSNSLAALVDAIIPGGEIPGAKDLEVDRFIEKMLADCYSSEVRKNVEEFLNDVSKQDFFPKNTTEKIGLIESWLKSPEKYTRDAINLIKSLCIQGYSTSEHVMTQFLNYEMTPGHFYGCVNA